MISISGPSNTVKYGFMRRHSERLSLMGIQPPLFFLARLRGRRRRRQRGLL
jgi:hypothetical protein